MSSIITTPRLPAGTGSIFAKMAIEAKRFNAINLSQGYPDFLPDPRLLDKLSQIIRGDFNQYGLPEGEECLRHAIAAMFATLYGIKLNTATEITVTTGATQAIFAAVNSLIHAGDEVIYLAPAFECYAPAVTLAGGVPVCVKLSAPDFLVDWMEVECYVSPKTRMVIVNNPHNPSGHCWTAKDIACLARLAEKYNLIVLSDEVYHNITFPPICHLTALSDERLRSRTVVVGSLGKILHVTGWRIGYSIAAGQLSSEIRKLLQFSVYAAPTPLQHAMAEMLSDKHTYLSLPEILLSKRDKFLGGLRNSRFRFSPTEGTYFQLIDYSEISTEPDGIFARRLITEHGIAAVPLSGFGPEYANSRLLRLCFAKKDETLSAATSILSAL